MTNLRHFRHALPACEVFGMSENRQEGPAQSSGPRKRGLGRPFRKGQPSPNPGGRPRLFPEVRALAQAHTDEVIETLVYLMHHSARDEVRRAAAVDLWDRAWGRPPSQVVADVTVVQAVDVDALRASLAARVAGLVAARESVHELGAHAPDSDQESGPLARVASARDDNGSQPGANCQETVPG